jgi:hypothetical protein
MDSEEVKKIPIHVLKSEDGAEELVRSEQMRPYVKATEALLAKHGLKDAIAEISRLPLEERYVWRVLSALKWGFADFDSVNVAIDRKTLSPDDRKRVAELIAHRPVQFCLFLKALVGDEAMEEMMTQAISVAKRAPSVS